MKTYQSSKRVIYLFVLLITGITSYAQLPDFTLTVTPTPQTCLGNGTLNFEVQGSDPAASIDYAVYLLPNTTTPITVLTTDTATGLSAGEYLVIATQSVGGDSNTSSANAIIVNEVETLSYTLSTTNVQCGNDGTITANITSGNPVSYEILTGPVTVPQQSSNVFTNLPAGLYSVRVYDDCGEASVITIQVSTDTTNIGITGVSVFGGVLPDCNTITIGNNYGLGTGGTNIFWPLTFEYSVYPPGSTVPIILSQQIASGQLSPPQLVTFDIPFYNDQEYYYDLEVTDACGNVFTEDNNIINQTLGFTVVPNYSSCDEISFTVTPSNFVGPVTVNFISSPAGFVPEDYSAQHPVFDGDAEYILPGSAAPFGIYEIQITDSCGRTVTAEFELTPAELSPQLTTSAICGEDVGTATIEIPGRVITIAIITSAPAAYGTVPSDVSVNVNTEGILVMDSLPLGTYLFDITDECGETYEAEVEVEVSGSDNLNVSAIQRAGCDIGFSSVRLNAAGDFDLVTITDGPAEYSNNYPVDVSANIAANGDFYMNTLPAGNYTFSTTDVCGIDRSKEVLITGYNVQVNELEVLPYCGSFQLDLEYFSNGNYVQSFWLQRFDENTGTWGHPETGVAYNDGLPTVANSIFINSSDSTPFYFAIGDFRIVKAFYTYSNGSTVNNLCTDVIQEFTFTGGPQITEVYSFPCGDTTSEVAVVVSGVPPFTYKITTKDGQPFIIDNGESSIFSNLEPAIYNFQVTDACQNIVNSQFNINTTDPVTIASTGFCNGADGALSVQPFSFLTYEWYEASSPGVILSTTNTLPFTSFDSDTDSGTYFVNITAENPDSCMNQLLEYTVEPSAAPNAGDDTTAAICNDGGIIDLSDYLSDVHDNNGDWQDTDNTGALNGSSLSTASLMAGSYNFKYTVVGPCGNTDDAVITITLNDTPDTPLVSAVDAVCEGESVQLSVNQVTGVTYNWTGPDNFTSTEANPVINNTTVDASGTYNVTATANGCTSDAGSVAVIINAVPNFTINGETAICEGQSSILNIVPQNFDISNVSYDWYYNGELLDDVTESTIEIFELGEFSVVVNNATCETSKSVNITQNTTGFDVVLEDGCENFEYILSIANIDEMAGSQFVWTGPDGYYYVGEEAIISNLSGGEYIVNVTNTEGCSVEGSVMVENTSCMIPRGISPNADEYNQYFDLSNLNVKDLQIFNRYGLKVYAKENYRNEWYGQSDKGDLPTGTYFYVLTLASDKHVTGWVYLQRSSK